MSAPSDQYDAFSASKVSPGANPSKENSSASGDGGQELVRLKGQPPRPDSKSQDRIFLASNYFQLIHQPDLKFWHYGIIVTPEIKGTRLTQIIKMALNTGIYASLKSKMVTDFGATMLSIQEIPQEYQNFKIRYKSELETEPPDNAKEYKITLDPIGIVDLSNPKAYLQHTHMSSSGLPIEQAFDIILGHHRKLSDEIAIVNKRNAFLVSSGAETYDFRDGFLIALRGYFSSVRMSQSSLLVNVNVTHGAFYKTPKLLSQIIRWLENHSSVDSGKVPGLLRGLRVSSSHILRVWSIWGYPKDGDGKGYMLHPPRFTIPNATRYTPEQIYFFHDEKGKDSSTDQAPRLGEKDKENAKAGKLKPHIKHCTCPGRWLTVASYFKDGIVTSGKLMKFILIEE